MLSRKAISPTRLEQVDINMGRKPTRSKPAFQQISLGLQVPFCSYSSGLIMLVFYPATLHDLGGS